MKNILFLILLFISSCSQLTSTKSNRREIILEDKKYTVLYDSVETRKATLLLPSFRKIDFFEVNDTLIVDSILVKIIEKNNKNELGIEFENLLEVNQYYKQILPFESKEGKKMIWVNCFCEYNPYWEKRVVQFNDGGSCYFNVLISLEKKTYSNLRINGF